MSHMSNKQRNKIYTYKTWVSHMSNKQRNKIYTYKTWVSHMSNKQRNKIYTYKTWVSHMSIKSTRIRDLQSKSMHATLCTRNSLFSSFSATRRTVASRPNYRPFVSDSTPCFVTKRRGATYKSWSRLQAHKRFKRTLFIRTKTQSANFRGNLFYQATK